MCKEKLLNYQTSRTKYMDKQQIIFKNILDRRTTKPDRYTGARVSDKIIHQMLEAAHWAPTHGHTEPWRFNVYVGEGKERLSNFLDQWMQEEGANDIKRGKVLGRIAQASHIISIGMKRGENPKIPEIEELLAVGMAVQNMWLMASAHHVGAYWSSGEKAFMPKMKDFLGLGLEDKSLGFLYVGELAQDPLPGHRLSSIEDHVKWIED